LLPKNQLYDWLGVRYGVILELPLGANKKSTNGVNLVGAIHELPLLDLLAYMPKYERFHAHYPLLTQVSSREIPVYQALQISADKVRATILEI
jgi:hypothetical protein